MKWQRITGIVSCVLLLVSCFMHWAWYPDIQEYFTGFYLDLKTDGNYSVNNQEGVTSGKWELVSANYIVFDKNTASERYFYVLLVEPKTMALRGPFKRNGEMKLNYLTTTYYQKP